MPVYAVGGGAGGEWTSGLGKRVVAGGMPKSYSAAGEVYLIGHIVSHISLKCRRPLARADHPLKVRVQSSRLAVLKG